MTAKLWVTAGIVLAGASTPAAAETTTDCLSGGVAASRAGDPARAVTLYREALSRPICQTADIEPLVRFSLARTLLTLTTPDAGCAAAAELERVVAASVDADVKAAAATALDTAKGRCLTTWEPAPTAAAGAPLRAAAPAMTPPSADGPSSATGDALRASASAVAPSPSPAARAPYATANPPQAPAPTHEAPLLDAARPLPAPVDAPPREPTRPPLATNEAPPISAWPEAPGSVEAASVDAADDSVGGVPLSSASVEEVATPHPDRVGGLVTGSRRLSVGARVEAGAATLGGFTAESVDVMPGWAGRLGAVFDWSLSSRVALRAEPGVAWQTVRFAVDDAPSHWEPVTAGTWYWLLAELPVLARVTLTAGLDVCAGLGGSVALVAGEQSSRFGFARASLDGSRPWGADALLGIGHSWELGALRLRGELRGAVGLVGVNPASDEAAIRPLRAAIGVEALF